MSDRISYYARVKQNAGGGRHLKAILSSRFVPWIGAAVLAIGIAASFIAARRQGGDFACMYFTAAGLVEKLPIYDFEWQKHAFPERLGIPAPQGMFYPPATGLALLPFGFLPFPIARTVWFVLMCTALVLGVRALVLQVRPGTGTREWLLIAGLVLLTAAVRWGMTPQQGAPLILGVLGLFAAAVHQGRWTWATLLAAFAVSFKTTLSLPFLGILVLYRRYASAAIAVGSLVLLNVAGFARLGGTAAFKAYQTNVAGLEAIDDINTPDPWSLSSVPRIDWIYLWDGLIRRVPESRLLALASAGLVGLWLLWQAYRTNRPTLVSLSAFMLGFTCLTNVSVYHHHYDLGLLVAPLLLVWLGPAELRQPWRARWLMLPLMVIMAVLPVALLQRWVAAALGPVGRGLLNLSFPVALTLTLVFALLLVKRLGTTRSI
jgi:hypothetical protein